MNLTIKSPLILSGSIMIFCSGCASSTSVEALDHTQGRTGLTGVVVDERGLPIPEAKVSAQGLSGVKTDEHGRFDLPNVVDEVWSLSITAEGYADATYFRVTPGSRLAVGLVPTLTIQVVLRGLGASSWEGLRFDLKLMQPWGDPKLSAESGLYGLQPMGDTDLEVRPGIYRVTVSLGGVRLAEGKELRLVPGCEPYLALDCKGIDWVTLAKAVEAAQKYSSVTREVIRVGIEERRSVLEKMRSMEASFAEELRRFQEQFDKSPAARLELRHRVDNF